MALDSFVLQFKFYKRINSLTAKYNKHFIRNLQYKNN